MNRVGNVMLESMMDTVIKKYGMENQTTISFCKLAEDYQKSGARHLKFQLFEIYREIA